MLDARKAVIDALEQVMANILNNAAKYTSDAGCITVNIECSQAQVTLLVKDNGIRMESELVSRAFGLFEQAERTADRSLGGFWT